MIAYIIKSYIAILLPVSIGAFLIFVLGLYFIIKLFLKKSPSAPSPHDLLLSSSRGLFSSSSRGLTAGSRNIPHPENTAEKLDLDLSAIAGDDVLTTQLDLARAYIETDKKQRAKKILETVILQGNAHQQQEAQHLLSHI